MTKSERRDTELAGRIEAAMRIQKYIDEHLDYRITYTVLKCVTGYSKLYAMRSFREFMGKTPTQYMNELRLAKEAQDTGGEDSSPRSE